MLDRLLYRVLTGAWGRFTFHPGPGPGWAGEKTDSLGLYVHIPFCRSLCSFCPYTKTLYSPELATNYLKALGDETGSVISRLDGRTVSSLYFGGGTPMTLPAAIESATAAVEPHLSQGACIGVELHPGDVTPANIKRLQALGAVPGAGSKASIMVSLGVQSLRDGTLRKLGRDHDASAAWKSALALMDAGLGAVNIDLITCVPGQNGDEVTEDLERLFRLGVGQVSAYPLMDFSFTSHKTSLSPWGQLHTLGALAKIGEAWGYRRSSVWTWTRPGFSKYTSVTRERFAGIGAGAATFVDGYFGLNTFDIPSYIDALAKSASPVALHTLLSPPENALYRLFWQCYEGEVDFFSPENEEIPGLKRWVGIAKALGLIHRDPRTGGLRLEERAFSLYHILERYYTRAYIGRLWALCRSEAFPSRSFVL